MVNQKKTLQVKKLQQKLQNAKSVVLTKYLGLKVAQIQALKKALRQTQGEFLVVKNTLLKIALDKSDYLLPKDKLITESTALIISSGDETAPVKKALEFAKENQLPQIKFGFFDKQFFSAESIAEISKLPPKQILISKLSGSLMSPLYRFCWACQDSPAKLVRVLKNYQTKKEQEVN